MKLSVDYFSYLFLEEIDEKLNISTKRFLSLLPNQLQNVEQREAVTFSLVSECVQGNS